MNGLHHGVPVVPPTVCNSINRVRSTCKMMRHKGDGRHTREVLHLHEKWRLFVKTTVVTLNRNEVNCIFITFYLSCVHWQEAEKQRAAVTEACALRQNLRSWTKTTRKGEPSFFAWPAARSAKVHRVVRTGPRYRMRQHCPETWFETSLVETMFTIFTVKIFFSHF